MLLFELLLNRLPIRKLLRISHLEPRGFEPLAFSLRTRRSIKWGFLIFRSFSLAALLSDTLVM